jgi:hypothetical protein
MLRPAQSVFRALRQMRQIQPGALARGLLTFVPGAMRYACGGTGGTDSARYCYSVWLRHLVKAARVGRTEWNAIAELGPGESLGIGLAAVLSGADQYFAFDVKEHAAPARNLATLDQLVELFSRREPIPGPEEFPGIWPQLDSYDFPSELLTEERLGRALAVGRLASIRAALERGAPCDGITIAYVVPWSSASVLRRSSVDFIFSQAVLEHVEDLPRTYEALAAWLRPHGLMSHTIDFKSHGTTRDWNGHWTLTDPTWRLIRGRRPYLINRMPHSVHAKELARNGFEVITDERRLAEPPRRSSLAEPFRSFDDTDLRTRGTFVQAIKPAGA